MHVIDLVITVVHNYISRAQLKNIMHACVCIHTVERDRPTRYSETQQQSHHTSAGRAPWLSFSAM